MRLMIAGTFAALLFLPLSAAAESPGELWRQGYEIVWESPYEDVEECTPDNAVVLSGSYVFICDSYEYVYHYGAVYVASRTFMHNGQPITSSYLCMEDEDNCLSGDLIRRRR